MTRYVYKRHWLSASDHRRTKCGYLASDRLIAEKLHDVTCKACQEAIRTRYTPELEGLQDGRRRA